MKKLTGENIDMNVVTKEVLVTVGDTSKVFETLSSDEINSNNAIVYANTLIFNKLTDTAIVPSKRDGDAAFDLYSNFPEGVDHVEIEPHSSIIVPTGIRVAIPQGFVGLLEERGSTGIINLKKNAGVVDSNYRGEMLVFLYNANNKTVVLSRNLDKTIERETAIFYPMSKAIAQMMVVPVPKFEVVEFSKEDFDKLTTTRGDGKLGSSGK